jgi:hypothetical protein
MYTGLMHLHSLTRWILVILLIAATLKAFTGWSRKRKWDKNDHMTHLLLMIVCDIQLVVGFALYFGLSPLTSGLTEIDMKNSVQRYWSIEHPVMMTVAVFTIHFGRILSKRAKDDAMKHRRLAVCYVVAIALIALAMPWPSRGEIGRPLIRGAGIETVLIKPASIS